MSELINNREHRKQIIKGILLDLHKGKSVEEVKPRFDSIAAEMDAAELSLIEQSLINEGIPVEEIQDLCDVHAAVFKEALSEKPSTDVAQGHPLDIYRKENQAIEELINKDIRPLIARLKTANLEQESAVVNELLEKINLLWALINTTPEKKILSFPSLKITALPHHQRSCGE